MDELGDRFIEILTAIHGGMPDSCADSARLAFVHATQEAQLNKVHPLTVRVAELELALHEISLCSQTSMSSKEECGRIARAVLAAARKP